MLPSKPLLLIPPIIFQISNIIIIIIFLLLEDEEIGTERLSSLSKVSQLVNSTAKV